MTPRLARRLLGLTATTLTGYLYGRVEASWGLTPLLVFTLIALTAWAAGYVWACQQHGAVTSGAVRDRDLALARIAELEDGGRYRPVSLDARRAAMAKHPSFLAKQR